MNMARIIPTALARNAWMSPDGTLYHVDDYGHDDAAGDILANIGLPPHVAPGDVLLEQGWVHVSCNSTLYMFTNDYVMCGATTPSFTQRQQDAAWDMFMDGRVHDSVNGAAWERRAMAQLESIFAFMTEVAR
jgi:hypothetical protein